jgi:hypothetical protein
MLWLYTVGNIKMDHIEVGWEGVDCVYLSRDRERWRTVVNTVMNILVS